MRKTNLLRGKVACPLFLSLVFLCGYLVLVNVQLKRSLQHLDQEKEEEFAIKLDQEKEFIRKDLEEKYAADIISYNAMAQRLEMEKAKVKQLQEQLKK